MKKSVILVLIISILLISVISVSLVSAGLLEDVWNKITGRVVDNETEAINETGAEEESETEMTNETEAERPTEESTESTQEPETCAAEIKIAWDKSVYYIGDVAKIVIEVLDSQGNRLPNYLFYGQTCDDQTGECTNVDSARTDADGYLKAEGELGEEEGIGRSEVWTEAIGNCPAIPVTMAKFELKKEKSEPVPCGIGTCIPEEEEIEEVEEIPEEKIFYACSGCELGDKCYPMGYRKEGKYCSDDYEFISQIDGNCDNDFECKSNVCVSGECVGEGLMRRIIKWFKRMFGGGDEEPEEPGLEMCSELLIEENIEDREYVESVYGNKDTQVAVYSENGEQIDIIKCCGAGYSEEDGEAKGTAGVICPFDNREDVENTIYWLSNKGEIILGEYKGQEVYTAGNGIVWTHNNFIIASGTDPNVNISFPDDIAEAYLDKYPNDLGEIVG